MTESLRKKAERGVLWSFIDAAGNRIVQFVIGVTLARLLLPAEFGLIGMLTIFIAVAQALLDGGFIVTLIQKKDVTEVDASSVFYFNVVIGSVLTGLMYLAAPWIASFYRQPDLCALSRAISLVFVINSLGAVQLAMLSRDIAFKIQAKVSLISAICSGGIGVTLAYGGYGVWSLVAQQISRALFSAVLLWVFSRWRPGPVFSFIALRRMFTFGSRLLVSGILDQVFSNIYYPVIGKVFSPSDLGYYTRATHLQELPSLTLTQAVARVALPVFSSIQDENARFKRGLQKVLCLLMFLIAPNMVLLAVTAPSLLKVLHTEKWLPCVPYLQMLSIQGVLYPLHVLNVNVLIARGRSDLFLRLEIIKKSLIFCNVIISWRWGITAIIIGQIALSFVSYFLNSYYTGKLLGYSAWEQLQDMAAYLVSAVAVGAGVYALQYVGLPGATLLLVVQVVFGVASYLLLCGLLRLPAFLDTWRLVAPRVPIVARFVS
ncbi:MAG: lipopolysaccharide biosynthesis protein [Phycisphaerales bacterium]